MYPVAPNYQQTRTDLQTVAVRLMQAQARYTEEQARVLAYHGIVGAPRNRHERRKAARILRALRAAPSS